MTTEFKYNVQLLEKLLLQQQLVCFSTCRLRVIIPIFELSLCLLPQYDGNLHVWPFRKPSDTFAFPLEEKQHKTGTSAISFPLHTPQTT